ncbi:putative ligase [Helianthus annuus]|nr:putative ligase [Helianthus annuus]
MFNALGCIHREASQKAHRSAKREGALGVSVTCRAEIILVANRGEILVRVIRTGHELGIPCVAVYSSIDEDALHVKLADESVCIGEAPSDQLYLLIPNVLSAAISHGLIYLLAPLQPDSIRVMRDKATARGTMKNVGVPTVPGSDGLLQSTEEGIRLADEIGSPVMIKATAGGGGRGMRLAKEGDEFVKLLQSEAAAAFGNDGVYLVLNPRHIEFQVTLFCHIS